MTYLVNDNCIKCKHTDCVEVCPVDCFYEGENMLVINPDECIDCGVCEPECPVDAIITDFQDTDGKWGQINLEYSNTWPNITEKKDAMPDADKWDGVQNKYEEHFSKEPGSGD
tara:strand:+ start:470 stop:808 length:339 start_codon:yes stop_codon:yes gene_type:complete